MFTKRYSLARLFGALALALGLALGGATVLADDDEPTAYLYKGSCAALHDARMVDEIDDFDYDDDWDDLYEEWRYIANGDEMPTGLMTVEDDLDDIKGGVQELVDGGYAIVVHETDSTKSPVLVCGDIQGKVQDFTLFFYLDEVDGSGWEGRAVIFPEDYYDDWDDDYDYDDDWDDDYDDDDFDEDDDYDDDDWDDFSQDDDWDDQDLEIVIGMYPAGSFAPTPAPTVVPTQTPMPTQTPVPTPAPTHTPMPTPEPTPRG